jgi:hypothetical protein
MYKLTISDLSLAPVFTCTDTLPTVVEYIGHHIAGGRVPYSTVAANLRDASFYVRGLHLADGTPIVVIVVPA